MNLRILLISDHYPPFIGGAHRQTQLLGRELMKRGHEVSVVTVWSPGLPEQEDDAGLTVYRLKQIRTALPWMAKAPGQRYPPPFPDPFILWPLRRLIGKMQPDIVHAYGWLSYPSALALLGRDIPLVISGRDYAYTCAARTMLYHGKQTCSGPALAKCESCSTDLYGFAKGTTATLGIALGRPLLRHKVRGVHSISAYVQETIQRDLFSDMEGGSGKHMRHVAQTVIPSFREDDQDVPSGDDPAEGPHEGSQLQDLLQRLPAEKFILFVGALRRVKGVELLLTAYQRLASPPPMVLIGTLESDSPREFPPGVTVLQNVPHAAVMAAWERSLFGAIPSLWPEPLGSVVYEGMSKGKAVIGTTPGGHADMIAHGQSGLLVPSGDVDALTEAMRQLIENPELRERLGMAALVRARQFTASVAVPQFERFYRRVIEDSTANHARVNETAPAGSSEPSSTGQH